MSESNYDKFPRVAIRGHDDDVVAGWDRIGLCLRGAVSARRTKTVLVVETYPGVFEEQVLAELSTQLNPALTIRAADGYLSSHEIDRLVARDVTDDQVFGRLTLLNMEELMDRGRCAALSAKIAAQGSGLVLVLGTGASIVAGEAADVLVYADMARWEIQARQRRGEIGNLGADNRDAASPAAKYKRAFFVDWRIADRLKRRLFHRVSFFLDTHDRQRPKLATGAAVCEGLQQVVNRPFRVVPFFDPGSWGGQWMKEVCDLDRSVANFAWCFDCVPEENSLLLGFGSQSFQLPSIDVVFQHPRELLGEAVFGRFGAEFPIRFDLLDTMGGGNLSLQVHPLTDYIQQTFGVHYTQDESYYMLDAGPNAAVYLGFKEGVDESEFVRALEQAQCGSAVLDAERFVKKWPARKHDHFLIPAGTIHCSGAEGVVLEISATPYIFTFKLWDWNRLGLDGKPRPIHLDHGRCNLQYQRAASWVKRNLINRIEVVAQGDGWTEEHTGLHEAEFIETRRHWFTGAAPHHTGGGVNVLNLVEGREAIVESPTGAFEPFVVHYAETFIVPAAVGAYTIRPHGASEGARCGTNKAFIRCAAAPTFDQESNP